MKTQKAIDVSYDRVQGAIILQELNQLLANGWMVTTTATSGSGNILVILEKDEG